VVVTISGGGETGVDSLGPEGNYKPLRNGEEDDIFLLL
jgi:hypothetical protein